MNNTQIDYLLQLATPRPDTPLAAGRPRDDAPGFDSHFRQASAPAPASSSPRPLEDENDHAPPRSSSAVERPAKPAEQSSQPADAQVPPAESRATEVHSAAGDDESTGEEHETDELAAADVVLAQSEPAAPAAVDELVAESELSLVDKPNTLRVDVGADSQRDARDAVGTNAADGAAAKPEQVAASSAVEAEQVDAKSPTAIAATAVKSERRNTAQPGTANPSVVASSREAAKSTTGESVESPAAPAIRPERASRTKVKSHRSEGDANERAPAGASGKDKPRAGASAAAESVAAVENETSNSKASAADNDRPHLATRTESAADEKPAPDRPRSAAADRQAAAPATPAVVANAQAALLDAAESSPGDQANGKPKETRLGAKDGLFAPLAGLERGGSLGTHGGNRTGDGETTPNVDPARFVSRVARAIHTAQERGGPLQLRLSPPELGAMRLEITVHQGALTATIETDNSTARQILLDNLPALRDRLAEQSIRIERFDVDVRSDGGGSQQNPGPYERGHDRQETREPHRTTTGRRAAAHHDAPETTTPARAITSTSINLVI